MYKSLSCPQVTTLLRVFHGICLCILKVCFSAAAAAAAAAANSLQSCPTLYDPTDGSPPGSPRPWDSQGKNTGVGCHFLLQCMKVKSESEVAQSCPTLSNAMDHSLPGSSVHGIFRERVLEWLAIAFSVASLPHSNLKKQSSASYPKPSTTMPLNLSFRNFLLPCV